MSPAAPEHIMMTANRRHFLQATTALALTGSTCLTVAADESTTPEPARRHCVFTKPLQSMPAAEMADRLAKMGFDGVECPVRRGGRIDPDNVEDQLPSHAEILASRGLRITIMTTDITDADDSATQRVLRTASELGIGHYRMAYYHYEMAQPIRDQIKTFEGRLKDLAALNADLNIQGLYQNHDGKDRFGAAIWDLHQAIAQIDPDQLGVAYDLRHATVEGGRSWPIALWLIRDHIRTLYVKDFRWDDGRVVNVPLGTGQTSEDFYRDLGPSFRQMPISLHQEYIDHRSAALVPQHLQAIDRDYATLRRWLG